MKILQVVSTLRVGGAEKLVADLLPALKQLGHDVAVAVFSGEHTIFREEIERQDIEVVEIAPGVAGMYSLKRVKPLRDLMKRFDVVHSHTTPAQYIAAIASIGLNVRMVTTEHSTNNRRRSKPYLKFVDRLMYGRYDYIAGCSEAAADSLQSYLGKNFKNITTIENGVDVERFKNAEPAPLIKPQNGMINAIMVGRFIHPKNQAAIIRALPSAPMVNVYFAGDGPELPTCKNMARELGVEDRCHFLGSRADIPGLFKAADVAVHSSAWEGLPLSVIEGMAASLPIVATDAPGIREVATDAGILFPNGDSEELAKIFRALCEDHDLRSEIAEKCACRAEDYSLRKMLAKYLELYSRT